MTMTTRYPMTCPCGHEGFVRMRENNQPFSSGWERYSLEGFEDGGAGFEPWGTFEQAFEQMKPKCPKCGRAMTPANMREPGQAAKDLDLPPDECAALQC